MFKGLSSLDEIFKNSGSISLLDGDKYKINNIDLINIKTNINEYNKENQNKINEEDYKKENQNKINEENKNENQNKINEENKDENLVNDKISTIEETKPNELKKEEEEIKEKTDNNLKKNTIITYPNSTISLPKDYSTNIEKEKELIELYNEDHSPGNKNNWELAKKEKGLEIYYKLTVCHDKEKTRSIILKTFGSLPFPLHIIWNYLLDFKFRKEYEPVYKEGKIIEEYDRNPIIKIVYGYIKMPFFMTDREILSKQYYFKNYAGKENTNLLLEHSIERDDFPIKEKPLRAEWEIRGIYLQQKNDKETIVKLAGLFNMKFNQDFVVNKLKTKGPEGQEKFFTDITKYIKEYIKKKKIKI